MSFRKRVLALAGAGVGALLLAGSFSAFHAQSPVHAGLPTNGAVGCATGSGTNIVFPATVGGPAAQINGTQVPQANGSTNAGTGGVSGLGFLSVLTPTVPVFCAPLLLDADFAAGGDGNNLTVDGGNLTALTAGPVQITNSNLPVYTWGCGAAIVDSCQGAQTVAFAPAANCPAPNAACLGPTAANTFSLIFTPGTSLGAIGGFAPIVTVTVTYSRFTVLGAGTFAVGTASITVLQPVYALVLTPSNGTISAALPSAAIAQTANTTTVITTSLYRSTTTPCGVITGVSGFVCTAVPIGGIGAPFGLAAPTFFFAPGGEPGVMTYQTSLGIWVGSSQSGGVLSTNTAAQTIAVQCGIAPATTPVILVPQLGQPFQLGLTSCQNTSATLAGGGAAGTAVIVVTYVGDFTGAQAQGSTEVNLVPGPSVANLTTGCNEVITPPSTAPGSNSAAILKLVSGFSVSSIWVFNNATHTFLAFYFSAAGAPTDIGAVGGNQSIFICGTGAGTFQVSP